MFAYDDPYLDIRTDETMQDYCDRKSEELELANDAYMIARYREQAQWLDTIKEN